MQSTVIIVVLAVVAVAAIIAAVVLPKSAVNRYKKECDEKIGSAEDKARSIIDEAVKGAEEKKREVMLEAKEENLKAKNELDKEIKERRAEISRNERRLSQKEENLDKKLEQTEKREAKLSRREEELSRKEEEVSKLNEQRVSELERISGLTSDEAKDQLLKAVEEDIRLDMAKMVKELENEAKDEADKKAKEYVVGAIQRCAVDHVAESTISVVQLPSDEMKGRIIGREGRNIRTIETISLMIPRRL